LKKGSVGDGSAITGTNDKLTWTNKLAGIYKVVATNKTTACTENMLGEVAITENPLPSNYTLTATKATYCTGENGGALGLSGSQIGVNYQLKKDGTNDGSNVIGTNSILSWTNKTAGSYTVVATDANGCTSQMTGAAAITELQTVIPEIKAKFHGKAIICIMTTDNQFSEFQWYNNGQKLADGKRQFLEAKGRTGSFYVEAIDANGCNVRSKVEPIQFVPSFHINPANQPGIYRLDLWEEQIGEVDVKIYDVLGKLTGQFKFEKTDESFSQELNLQGLMPGVYLTEIRIGGEKVCAEKVVVK